MVKTLAFLAVVLAASSSTLALWPLPKNLQTGSTAVRLAPNFEIKLSINHAPADLQAAVLRTKAYLKTDKLERLVVGRGASDSHLISGAKSLSSLTITHTASNGTIRSISDEAKDAIESRDEAYTLTVPGDGSTATLSANSTLGLYRGLTTFGQIWYDYNGATYTLEAPIQIQDAPAYVSYQIFI